MTDTHGTPSEGGPDEGRLGEGRDGEKVGPVIRDKRRIDPETGERRQPEPEAAPADDDTDGVVDGEVAAGGAGSDGDAAADDLTGVADDLHPDSLLAAERLEEMRRMQAEFVNFRNRTQRERELDKGRATGAVVESLLPVLDDIHSAREHGDLTEGSPFAAIADKLEQALGRFGVERVGAVGDVFDPNVHEALMHLPAEQAQLPEGTTEMTVVQVMQPGFKVGDQVVRAARVAVADPG
ncbi:nucleotide exchange factor GrpE [Serinicoccus sp. LYQ131]|uniref:nucleotide exchange factor GrpE n=1 Tax=Serinicoccus sp. LYQ131 TaxID=3378797 RepID=UPI0038550E4C